MEKLFKYRLREGGLSKMDGAHEEMTDEHKFQRDLSLICELLRKAMHEVLKYSSYFTFMTCVDHLEKERDEEETLLANHEFNTNFRAELKKAIVENKKRFTKGIARVNDKISKAITELGYVGCMRVTEK